MATIFFRNHRINPLYHSGVVDYDIYPMRASHIPLGLPPRGITNNRYVVDTIAIENVQQSRHSLLLIHWDDHGSVF